ncbi:MAG: domain S-box/diguanylate cyclase protein [Frankiales bacterium]|nr:domain S-box/diguanylate cyclase protein [Frankiales bacterium]
MIPLISAPSQSLGHNSELRLLVIEDSTADSELVLALLEGELPHAVVDTAANLHDALDRLRASPFDLVLADLSLPDADGLSVVHAVRAEYPQTALLVLTGREDGQLALWALAEGAQDYLVKGEHDGPRLATALLHALQRQRSEEQARSYLQLARGLLDALEAPTCAVGPDGVIVAMNAAWQEFSADPEGVSGSWGIGTSYLRNCDQLVEAGLESAADAQAVADGLRSVLAGEALRHQFEYARQGTAEARWFSARITPTEIGDGRGAVISHVDVTDMHRAQVALAHQGLHDALTGLPNRVLLSDRLKQGCADAHRRGRRVAVAFLDLDHFKRVNDSLGHAAGDILLVQVAQRLASVMREGDTLARYSGDEFVIVWRDLALDEDLTALPARVFEVLTGPFDLGDTSINLSVSVGMAASGGDAAGSVDELLMAADAAMYDAKRQGGARLRVFSAELREELDEFMTTEVDLRAALQRSELVLHYQPVIDLTSGNPVAVEALVRWDHPQRGLLTPSHFIPVAETSGLIVPLGKWVIERACRDAAAFHGAAEGLDVAVNLSVLQLIQPDIVGQVRGALQRSGLAPERLLLEVTESVFMHDVEAAAATLNGLAQLGARIAIDDFGTGYSSLLYLRRYPIRALKLDRAFVSGIGLSLNDEAICNSVVALARAIGATSIGEGVETVEQFAALRALGCQQGQGFLWSAAVPAADLARVVVSCSGIEVPDGSRTARRRSAAAVLPELVQRVESHRARGWSEYTIAAALNQDGVLRPGATRWTAAALSRHVPRMPNPQTPP